MTEWDNAYASMRRSDTWPHGWLIMLSQGWAFSHYAPEPIRGWSVMMRRDVP